MQAHNSGEQQKTQGCKNQEQQQIRISNQQEMAAFSAQQQQQTETQNFQYPAAVTGLLIQHQITPTEGCTF